MAVVVDSCIWVDHFNRHDPSLARLLAEGEVLITETVLGELLVGNLVRRKLTAKSLLQLPRLATPGFDFVLHFLEEFQIFGLGLGWGDLNILATCYEQNIPLYTRDLRLQKAASKLSIAYRPSTS